MATYLVTGAAGFIGSNLVRALLARGEEVRGLDNFVTGRRGNIDGLDGLDFVEGDVTDAATVARLVPGVDYILHQAAVPSVPRSLAAPLVSHHANITGTLVLLEAARGCPTLKRFVYASSSSVYGDTPVLPKIETMTPLPRSPYAVTKLAGEQYALVYARVFGVPTVALRYFNVFGPRQDPESPYAAVIPKFIRAALSGESPTIYGDGTQSRDFTYIDNVVEANLKACEAPDAVGEALNVACGERVRLLDLLASINALLSTHAKPSFAPSRQGDILHSLADIEKAKRLIGYSVPVPFAAGIEQTVSWYRTQAQRSF